MAQPSPEDCCASCGHAWYMHSTEECLDDDELGEICGCTGFVESTAQEPGLKA